MSVQPEAREKQQVAAGRDAFAAGRDLTVAIAAPDPGEPATPALLPRDVPGFTGRDDELSRLVGLAGGGRVVVTAIGGTAGVGKTALAVHAAHQLLREFPDGHLYADLRGYTGGQDPVEPGEALELFLRSLGVKAEDIPSEVTERSGLLRQLLAPKRVVMVLDNARTEAQVRPLLPGAGTSLVLVTSRSTLPGLEADERISLDVLSQDEAVDMLAGLGGHRAAADPTAVAEVARLCGRLPLALRIAGQLLATHPTWPVVRVAQLLAGQQQRLTRLGAGDLQVRAAFEVSYQQLADGDARLFRLLGLHPGPDFSATAAAALAGLDEAVAESALERLATAHLLAEDTVGRFTLHDLLRLFARASCEQADAPDQRTAAETRLIRHYEQLASFLESCVDPGLRAVAEQTGRPLSSMRQALAVFQAERPSLLAALDLVTQRGWNEDIRWLSASMEGPLAILRFLDDLLTVREAALAAGRRSGDAGAEGRALANLGSAYLDLRRFEEAIARYEQALTIFQAAGDRDHESKILNNLGIAFRELRRFDEAIPMLEQALALRREVGDRPAEGQILNSLGSAYRELRRFEEAIACYQRALAIFQGVGDRDHESRQPPPGVGSVNGAAPQLGDVLSSFERKMAAEWTGDRDEEGRILISLGNLLRELQRFDEAIPFWEQAVAIKREVGNGQGEAQTLANLGHAYRELRRSAEAIGRFQQALAVFRAIGDRHGESRTLNNLGVAFGEARRFADSIEALQQALAIERELGDRYGEGHTQANLGLAYTELQRFDEALASYRESLAIARETGDRDDEGETLAALAHVEQLAGNARAQRRRWWQRARRSSRTARGPHPTGEPGPGNGNRAPVQDQRL